MNSSIRINLLFFGFLVVWGLIILTLFRIQVIDQDHYIQRAKKQFETKVELPAKRGFIYDATMEKLAYNEPSFTVNLELPKFFSHSKSEQSVAIQKISESLNLDEAALFDRIEKNKSKHTIRLRSVVSESMWTTLLTHKIKGLTSSIKYNRVYDDIAHNTLGYTDIDNKGISGLEQQFDEFLHGKNGFKLVQKDGRGGQFHRTDYAEQLPENGGHIQLTINRLHQTVLEKELKSGLKKYNAKSVSGVLMDPYTGEIIAMASYPSYNSNDRSKPNQSYGANRNLIDVFDPGSTFKMVTAAAALEEGVIKPQDIIFCENGRFRVGPKIYRDDVHRYQNLSFREVIEKSSNIGTIKVAQKLGNETFYRYVRDFGFGSSTETGLHGEADGILHKPESWSQISLSSMSIGHEVSVTTLQLAQAYAVIANGGVLVRPQLIRAKLNAVNDTIWKLNADQVRRVISESTADTLKSFLFSVVKRGTGSSVYQKEIPIAGKTGTAQVFDKHTKSYSNRKVVASFAGFFPFEAPKFVCVISVNEPKYVANYGSTTAAPIFSNIAKQLMSTIENDEEQIVLEKHSDEVYIPDFIGLTDQEAFRFLEKKNVPVQVKGEGVYIIGQTPTPGVYKRAQLEAITVELDEQKAGLMPDLRGLTIREAIQKIKRFRFELEVKGSGVVYEQSIRPDTEVSPHKKIVIKCRRK